MTISTRRFKPLAFAALMAAGAAAHATYVTYASQDDFVAQVSAVGTDTFADVAAGELAGSLQRTAGAHAYTVSSQSGLYGAGNGWLSNNDRREALTFSGFSAGVTALGGIFFGTNDAGDALTNQQLSITVTDTSLAQQTFTLTMNSATAFFGVVSSTPLLSLSVAVDAGNLLAAWPAVASITAAVPEPSTYALMLAGAGVLALCARRRRDGSTS